MSPPGENKDWSQEKLAELSGLHATNIGKIERGEADPSFGTVKSLARALDIRLRDLMDLVETGTESVTSRPVLADARTLSVAESDEGGAYPSGVARPLQFIVVIQPTRDGFYASAPDLPGCAASGRTAAAAEAAIREAATDNVEGLRRAGRDVPAPTASARLVTLDG